MAGLTGGAVRVSSSSAAAHPRRYWHDAKVEGSMGIRNAPGRLVLDSGGEASSSGGGEHGRHLRACSDWGDAAGCSATTWHGNKTHDPHHAPLGTSQSDGSSSPSGRGAPWGKDRQPGGGAMRIRPSSDRAAIRQFHRAPVRGGRRRRRSAVGGLVEAACIAASHRDQTNESVQGLGLGIQQTPRLPVRARTGSPHPSHAAGPPEFAGPCLLHPE